MSQGQDCNAAAAAGIGGRVSIKGKDLILQVPTPADLILIDDDTDRLADAECPDLLARVLAMPADVLKGGDRTDAIDSAVRASQSGPVTSSRTYTRAAYSLAGCRKRLWRLTRRTHPELAEKDIADLIGDEDRPAVITALDAVLKAANEKKV